VAGLSETSANNSSLVSTSLIGIALVPIFSMAHHEHNASAQQGVAPSNDLALHVSQEHQHEHLHHSARAAHDDHIVYTTGTTDERSIIPDPSAQDHGLHHRLPEKHGLHEQGAYEKNADVDYEEKGTRGSSTDPEAEVETKSKWSVGALYRRFRWAVHIFLAALFTG
jgi:CNT family concentrative nucleoside transporter